MSRYVPKLSPGDIVRINVKATVPRCACGHQESTHEDGRTATWSPGPCKGCRCRSFRALGEGVES